MIGITLLLLLLPINTDTVTRYQQFFVRHLLEVLFVLHSENDEDFAVMAFLNWSCRCLRPRYCHLQNSHEGWQCDVEESLAENSSRADTTDCRH